MNPALPLPKYHQIYLVLREQLGEGLFADGQPGELALMQAFSVSRVTVAKPPAGLMHPSRWGPRLEEGPRGGAEMRGLTVVLALSFLAFGRREGKGRTDIWFPHWRGL